MGVTIPVGFGQVRYVFQQDGITWPLVTTLTYDPPTTDPQAHAVTLTTVATAAGRPFVSSGISTQARLQRVEVTEMTDTGPVQGLVEANLAGTSASAMVPPNVSLLIRKTTASGGRRNKGRMYVPSVVVVEGNVDQAGMYSGSLLPGLQTVWTAFYDALITAGLPPVICHSEVPFTPTPVTGFVVQQRTATQRRRLRR